VSAFIARAVLQDLRQHGYDVFMDVESIDSGEFETIILAQIAARAHFLVILTQGTLEGCQEPNDWLRREIEYAIGLGRNVVPILVNDFRFDRHTCAYLTGTLGALPRYNGLTLSPTTISMRRWSAYAHASSYYPLRGSRRQRHRRIP
jgi:hypothetical protein